MKVNRLIVAFFAIVGMQTAFATIFDVINLDSDNRDKSVVIILYFKDAADHVGYIFSDAMQYQEKGRVDSEINFHDEDESLPVDFSKAKLDHIELSYFYGDYNASVPLSWDSSDIVWTNKINWQWSKEEIEDRKRVVCWQIFNLGRLNIPAATLRIMMDTVQIRIHSHGKCDIIQGGSMKTLQGRLHEQHPEDV